eukprot:2858360-Rhodomonas_salina.2
MDNHRREHLNLKASLSSEARAEGDETEARSTAIQASRSAAVSVASSTRSRRDVSICARTQSSS